MRILFFWTKLALRQDTAAPASRTARVLCLVTNTGIKFRGSYSVSPFGCRVPVCLYQGPPSLWCQEFCGPHPEKIRAENQHSNSVSCHQTEFSESHCLIFWPPDIRVPGALSDGSYSIAHLLLCEIAFPFHVYSHNTNKLVTIYLHQFLNLWQMSW